MKKRICVLTAGHLATTPRMVKAADAFADEGYDVSVVSTQYNEWADEADRSVLASRWSRWRWTTVDFRKRGAPVRNAYTALRAKAVRQIARARGVRNLKLGILGRMHERVFPELVAEVVHTRPSLIYGGGNALAASAGAAEKAGVPFAFDLESFRGEGVLSPGEEEMLRKLELDVLPRAEFLTSSSEAISAAYKEEYGLDVTTIHNVFPLPATPPTERKWDGKLRLYWFGQTARHDGGFGVILRALGLAGIPCELTIRGNPEHTDLALLMSLAQRIAPSLTLSFAAPAPPDDMVDLCRLHDVGISIPDKQSKSERLALSNKALTYILAGLAEVMTDTPGQHAFGTDLGDGALMCAQDDADGFARGLREWGQDQQKLSRAKEATWEAAKRRWHWEHPEERDRLLGAIADACR